MPILTQLLIAFVLAFAAIVIGLRIGNVLEWVDILLYAVVGALMATVLLAFGFVLMLIL